jgi:hypothetical protein
MKDLIKLVKSDNYLMLISLVMFALAVSIVVILCHLFPTFCQVAAIIISVAVLTGGVVTIAALYFMYQVEKACNKENNL